MGVTTADFGEHQGRAVRRAVLDSGAARVAVLSYGCVVQDWRVPAQGGEIPVVLGFDRFEHYPVHSKSFGVIAGRVANRTAHGRFRLGGREIQLDCGGAKHHLHGGPGGLGVRLWEMETDSAANAVRLAYHSPDGEMGYPGAVDFTVTMRLDGPRLSFEMDGRPDRETPVNLAQHNYYNLAGGGDVTGHELLVRADRRTPTDEELIPTGELPSVDGGPLDFRAFRRMVDDSGAPLGIDENLCLTPGRDPSVPAAEARCAETGLALKLWTDQPAVQVFNAPTFDIAAPGLDGRRYGAFCGLCLEAQHFPDSLNNPQFPSILCSPEAPYRQVTAVEIA